MDFRIDNEDLHEMSKRRHLLARLMKFKCLLDGGVVIQIFLHKDRIREVFEAILVKHNSHSMGPTLSFQDMQLNQNAKYNQIILREGQEDGKIGRQGLSNHIRL